MLKYFNVDNMINIFKVHIVQTVEKSDIDILQ